MKLYIITFVILFTLGCKKELDLKPNSSLVVPKTVEDFENLLNNSDVINSAPGLPLASSDEYYIPTLINYQALDPTIQAPYIWSKDIFGDQTMITEWTVPYNQIFYANSILDAINKQTINGNPELMRIKGWALFVRSFAFYNLVSVFSKAYNLQTANNDLGVPLKLTSGVTELGPRSTLQKTYEQIIGDAVQAGELLQQNIPENKKNRPSKVAAYAFLARVYLSMRNYDEAEKYADKTLLLYSKLTAFSTLPISSTSSFTINSEETIYFSRSLSPFYNLLSLTGTNSSVDTVIINSYSSSDLRKSVYFQQKANGNWYVKGINSTTRTPFTGLATDEIYLIKAECLARRELKEDALILLNTLIKTRISGIYIPITALNANEALEKILTERRKQLVWRNLRWTDIKRYNLEGRGISLIRNLGGKEYKLEPNSPNFVLPIPSDEVSLSGIIQNVRQ